MELSLEQELVESILDHWRIVRSRYISDGLNDMAKENLRCTQDLVELLRARGIIVPDELWKFRFCPEDVQNDRIC